MIVTPKSNKDAVRAEGSRRVEDSTRCDYRTMSVPSIALASRRRQTYAYHAGKIVSLGDGVALVDLFGIRLTGRIAWWIYRAAYLLKLVGLRNKAHILSSLALQRFFGQDISGELPVASRCPAGDDRPAAG